jgi:outer membrane protein assembly factor BamB
MVAILLLGIGAAVYTRGASTIDPAFRNPLLYLVALVTFVLMLLWLILLSRLRWRNRLLSLGVVLIVVVGAIGATRFDGFYGNFVPQFRWRWTPPEDTHLPEATATQPAIDLVRTAPSDYPRFLGAAGLAKVEGIHLARDWSAQPPRELWRQPIGAGWSGFAVVATHAVTQEQRGEWEWVSCYELTTGRLAWVHRDQARFHEAAGGDGPRATPTIADGRVYSMGATGLLNCLDGSTGRVVWSRDILAECSQKNLMWGKSCSPLVFDNLVVVTLGESTDRPLAAYDRATGRPVWRAGHDKPSYATPVLATLAGRRQILAVNAESASAHDPADGRLLWEYPWPGKMAKCAQPVAIGGDRVFISSGYGLGCVLLQAAVADNGQLRVAEVWHNRQALRTRFANIVTRDGFAYGLDEGTLACVELATGVQKWGEGSYGHGQVLLVDDLLLITTESGDLVLVEASPTGHHELSRLKAVTGKTWNNPALSGRHLLVRNAQEAVCYELPVSKL